jgi:hypothetical protein
MKIPDDLRYRIQSSLFASSTPGRFRGAQGIFISRDIPRHSCSWNGGIAEDAISKQSEESKHMMLFHPDVRNGLQDNEE